MKTMGRLTLQMLLVTISFSHVFGITLSKHNEKEDAHLKTESWEEDYLLQWLLSIQLPQEDELSPFDSTQDPEEEFWFHKKNDKTQNPSNDSRPSNDTRMTEAYVDAGQLILLNKNVTSLHRQDILTSSLFAQLAADYKYDRRVESKDWYNYYGQIMGQVGWVLEKSFFGRVKTDDYFILSDVVDDLFEKDFNDIDQNTLHYLAKFLNCFNDIQLEDEVTVDLFYNITFQNNSVNFVVTLTSEQGADSLQLFSIQVSFTAQCEMTKEYLFYLLDSKCVGSGVDVGVSQYLLNEPVFARSRDIIVQRLGARAKHYIVKMKLN